jgi:hypothetical protein
MNKIHCPWCSKIVSHHKGRLVSHVTAGAQKCVGVGQDVDRVAHINRQANLRLGWGVDGIPRHTKETTTNV